MQGTTTRVITFVVSFLLSLLILRLFFDWGLSLGMAAIVHLVYALVWFRRP